MGLRSFHGGLAAERSVARLYERSGYRPAAHRWRGQAGEIDLVFQNGRGYVFVEVKKSGTFRRAAEALTLRQRARLARAIEEYIGTRPDGLLSDVRFDAALVNGNGEVRILENEPLIA